MLAKKSMERAVIITWILVSLLLIFLILHSHAELILTGIGQINMLVIREISKSEVKLDDKTQIAVTYLINLEKRKGWYQKVFFVLLAMVFLSLLI